MLISQIWFQGASEAPAKYAAFRDSWRNKHPEADIITWDQESIEALIDEHYSEWRFLYDLMPLMIQKIDIAKIFIIHRYGGSYVDMDSESLRPLDDFVLQPGITLSYVNSNWVEHLAIGVVRGHPPRRFVNNGIIICPEPGNPFWIYYLERLRQEMRDETNPLVVRERTISERLGGESVFVMNTTGPLLWTDSVHAWNQSHPGSIRLLHHSYLEPIFGRDPKYLQNTYPWSYVKHQHAGSWTTNKKVIQVLTVYYHWIRPHWVLWLSVIMFTSITLILKIL